MTGFFRIILILCFSYGFAVSVHAREIAFTFDDAPTPDSVIMSGAERTDKLIKALKKASMSDALFFIKAGYIDENTKTRLEQYTRAGFHLANHSYSHRSANEISADEYLTDVYQAKLLLDKFDNLLPYYRPPYLHYGKTLVAVKQLHTSLSDMGYRDGYVTVDNFDWYINALLVKAVEQGHTIDYAAASRFYVETLYQAIEFYDELAVETLGRSPKHVLLLHENDAAALFVGDLIDFLRDKGWKIISPQKAYQDAIAADFPATAFQKQGRVAAMAAAKGVDETKLRHASENTELLDKLFEQAKIIGEK
jgi:peptidoglycan/xylan/chitin deacetylase (PgdA/CDA1 family)